MSDPFAVPSPNQPPQIVTASINEPRLLAQMKHFFSSSHSAVGELMQNARRAGATAVHFDFDPVSETLTVTDDGHEIEDFGVLIRLCASGWDDATMRIEQPFGMGLFSVLFAAQSITVRSRGLAMVVTLDDVTHKRPIPVLPDSTAPQRGTRLELRSLTADFLGKSVIPGMLGQSGLTRYQLFSAIWHRAFGFAIPVWLDGAECERPLAQQALQGEMSSIGFVSMRGVHFDCEGGIGRLYGPEAVALCLQGLPLGERLVRTPNVVVHLDTNAFTPTMPDRASLYDEDAALDRIHVALQQLARDHLVASKASLGPAEFVLRHWDDCRDYGMLRLLDDIPYIPRHAVRVITEVTQGNADDCEPEFMAGYDPERPHSDLLISKEDITSACVRIRRCVPDRPAMSAAAALVLKLMQREGIGKLWLPVASGHWINACTPAAEDLRFKVTPVGAHGHASYLGSDWLDRCDVQVVERVDVEVVSDQDPGAVLKLSIQDDWVMVPEDHADAMVGFTPISDDYRAVCFVTAADGANGHPVDAMSAFTDENHRYREDWRKLAKDQWDALVAGLRGESLAQLVGRGLAHGRMVPRGRQVGQLAIVSASPKPGTTADVPGRFQVLDAHASGFWAQVASELAVAMPADAEELAVRIEQAVRAVVASADAGKPAAA